MANDEPPFGASPVTDDKKRAGFFGGKHDDTAGISLSDLSMQLNNVSRRLRIIEERYTAMRKKMELTDETILGLNKQLTTELKVNHSEVVDFRREFYDLRDKVKLIVKELKDCAKTEEVKVLENYINLWEPVTFVTRNEFDKIVDQKIEEKLAQQPLIRE